MPARAATGVIADASSGASAFAPTRNGPCGFFRLARGSSSGRFRQAPGANGRRGKLAGPRALPADRFPVLAAIGEQVWTTIATSGPPPA